MPVLKHTDTNAMVKYSCIGASDPQKPLKQVSPLTHSFSLPLFLSQGVSLSLAMGSREYCKPTQLVYD